MNYHLQVTHTRGCDPLRVTPMSERRKPFQSPGPLLLRIIRQRNTNTREPDTNT